MCIRVHESQYRESQYLGKGERCNRCLHALRCLVYQWVGQGDSTVVTRSRIMKYACLRVHVALVWNHASYPCSDVSSDSLIDHLDKCLGL